MLLLPTWPELKQAFHAWNEDRVPTLAAALAYTSALALAPMLVIVLGVAGIFSQSSAAQSEIVSSMTAAVGPQAAELITGALSAGEKANGGYVAVVVGTIVALVSSVGAMRQLQKSTNVIWAVPSMKGFSTKLVMRYVTLVLVLALTGTLVLVSTVLSAVLSHQGRVVSEALTGGILLLQLAQAGVSLVLIAFAFSLLFKILPETRVEWRHVWFSGLFTALLFNVGKYLMAWYLAVGSVGSVYGAAGSFAAIMVWIFYATQIFLYGIELVKIRQHHSRLPMTA